MGVQPAELAKKYVGKEMLTLKYFTSAICRGEIAVAVASAVLLKLY